MQHDSIKKDIGKIAKIRFCNEKDRAKLILVYLGLKPVCSVFIYEEEGHLKTKEILSEVGLYSKPGKFNKEWFDNFQEECEEKIILPIGELCVAKEKENVFELLKISSAKDHQRYGELMGYPQSAIDNFIKQEPQLDYYDLEKMQKEHGVIFSFRIPRENYQKELEVLKSWSMAIKKYAPQLYEELWKQEQQFNKISIAFHEKNEERKNKQ